MLSRQQNGRATPLAAPGRPQTPQGKHPDAPNNRPDGLSRAVPPPPPVIPQKACAREACKKLFSPSRPNQAYCPGDCRQRALEERKVAGLTSVLEEIAGAAEELRKYANGHNDPIYNRMVTLAEKAAEALHHHRSKK